MLRALLSVLTIGLAVVLLFPLYVFFLYTHPKRHSTNITPATLGLEYENRYNRKLGLGFRLNYNKPASDKLNMGIRNISFAPYITYSLGELQNPRVFVSSGVGMSFRRLTAKLLRTDENMNVLGILPISLNKLSLFSIVSIGLDFLISKKVIIGFRSYLDYHLGEDPTRGAFGDTGGFHFMGRFGFLL